MGSVANPRLLANQLIVSEMLRKRQVNLDSDPSYWTALNGALMSCNELDIDEITKAEVRALIVAMRPAERPA